ncbi:hypothetical protein [Holospora obtusa]|uniref:hypothetical protein n=1 Tax=Holospora obtusa TaxID=49893 RepID=UPI0003AF01D1|nr:hypothetical protein [Holospora obtusa]
MSITYQKILKHKKADPKKRFTFFQNIEKPEKEDKLIIYIDERGFALDILRRRGHTLKGERSSGKHD